MKLEKVGGGFCVEIGVILFLLVQILAQKNPLITSFVLRVETPLWDENCLSYNRLIETKHNKIFRPPSPLDKS